MRAVRNDWEAAAAGMTADSGTPVEANDDCTLTSMTMYVQVEACGASEGETQLMKHSKSVGIRRLNSVLDHKIPVSHSRADSHN